MAIKVVGVTQARYGSNRLPGKLLKTSGGKTMLYYHLKRIKEARLVSEWIMATTNEPEAADLVAEAEALGVSVFKGSTEDVLDRVFQAVKDVAPDYVVRVTSDCPLLDGSLIDRAVERCLSEDDNGYYFNAEGGTLPDGMDVEVFAFSLLAAAWKNAKQPSEREHVTPYIRKALSGPPTTSRYPEEWNKWRHLRMTLDEPADVVVIDALVSRLGADRPWEDYARTLLDDPEISAANGYILRNEGYFKSMMEEVELRDVRVFTKSDSYRGQIHKLIPGGAHTYSKGDDQFPQRSPAALTHGTGSHVWDVDGNEFLDCSMGLTAVSLGHAFDPVCEAVKSEVDRGVNFQRPSILEKAAAERFLSLVPQHDMIKFAKNGSIVTTAAVKLARAKTGRKLVAFPGNHPFYSYDDWFIGTTACSKGVPEETSALSVTFDACDASSLEALFQRYPGQIACVITEPEKSTCVDGVCPCRGDAGEFLKRAIEITHEHGALFIQDEMITGFKTAFPGSISKHGLKPDMATWGKGIANGFSFCALTGTRDVMDQGSILNRGQEKVFLISTTHGGETHGLAAAISCIDFFGKNAVVERLHSTGSRVVDLAKHVVSKHKLDDFIHVTPSHWMPTFGFKDNQGAASQGFRTLFMQEMIAKGVLFQGVFVPCYSHSERDLYYFAAAFDHACSVYKKALEQGVERFLVGEPAKPVFRKVL